MWEDSQRRHKAAVILGSWEMVTWYGIAGDEVRFYIAFLDSDALPTFILLTLCLLSLEPCYCQKKTPHHTVVYYFAQTVMLAACAAFFCQFA